MALARIGFSKSPSIVMKRYVHSVNIPLNGALRAKQAKDSEQPKSFHVTSIRRYPDAPTLPLPDNISEIFSNETGRFTPERSRDIAGRVLVCSTSTAVHDTVPGKKSFALHSTNDCTNKEDSRVDSYDCTGAVSLNSSMQSTVPQPCCSVGKSTYLNMPGGQWAKDGKYIAEHMQKSHYATIKPRHSSKEDGLGFGTNILMRTLTNSSYNGRYNGAEYYSTNSFSPPNGSKTSDSSANEIQKMPMKNRLKLLVRDYGITVLIFHTGISLISLGICYVGVSSGVDMTVVAKTLGFQGNANIESALKNTSTFLVAYSIHKLLVPLRFSLTLACTPVIVRYLRNKKLLPLPKR
ncbi:uncharacterized protein LOC107274244 [Cephus cinctus]|uniref:Uncharacterized protein LOC107274244 n=1 Tax=Cephus cinctus TaxID=211228 RepID=A0AAJ7CEM3_CEPCN|nr:uncharacterized protein LOC107274244 [Cephus cinctus]